MVAAVALNRLGQRGRLIGLRQGYGPTRSNRPTIFIMRKIQNYRQQYQGRTLSEWYFLPSITTACFGGIISAYRT